MIRGRTRAWWRTWPVGVTAGVAALGAAGTFLVRAANYIQVPDRLEAAERKNTEQDAELKQLTEIQQYWKGVYDAQQKAAPKVEEVSDDGEIKVLKLNGKKWCCDGTDCWTYETKTKCAR